MRRRSSLVLLVVAVFCAALAPLLREYVFPRVVAKSLAGDNAYRVTVLHAHDATLLGDPAGDGKADVTVIETIRPDARASHGQTVVWDLDTTMLNSAGAVVTQIPEVYAFDAVGQTPKNCCGESIDSKPATHTGIEYKWPFYTQKRDYNYYDAQAHSAATITYKGTQTRGGLKTYVFEQTVPWTQVPVPSQLPGGLTPASVQAAGMQRWYTTVRTFWVEPVTGTPVYATEQRTEEMRTPASDPAAPPATMTVFSGTIAMDPAYSAKLISDVKARRDNVVLLHDTLPTAALVTGIVLFLASLLLELLDRRRANAPRTAGGPALGGGSGGGWLAGLRGRAGSLKESLGPQRRVPVVGPTPVSDPDAPREPSTAAP